jgi:hypothetical protein
LPDLASGPVGVVDAAGQADGVVAVAGLGDQLGPPRIAVAGPLDDLPEDAGQQKPTRTGAVMLAYPACGQRQRWGWSPWKTGGVESGCREDV